MIRASDDLWRHAIRVPKLVVDILNRISDRASAAARVQQGHWPRIRRIDDQRPGVAAIAEIRSRNRDLIIKGYVEIGATLAGSRIGHPDESIRSHYSGASESRSIAALSDSLIHGRYPGNCRGLRWLSRGCQIEDRSTSVHLSRHDLCNRGVYVTGL